MADNYCPTCAGEGEIEVPDTWDVAPNGNDADGPWVCEHAACPTCGGDGLTPEGRTMTLSILEFGGRTLYTQPHRAFIEAHTLADASGCPCVVWQRDGWHLACEVCPELMDVAPESAGWHLAALVDPRAAWHAPELVDMPSPRECVRCGEVSTSNLPTCDDCGDRVCQRCAMSGHVAGVVTWCLCNDCEDPSENHLTWNTVS